MGLITLSTVVTFQPHKYAADQTKQKNFLCDFADKFWLYNDIKFS